MRMVNPLHYTEHHRYIVYRDFSLGPLESKMLTGVYQPMIGAVAAGLYSLLLQQLPAERSGYSGLEMQRKLFQGLDLEPNEQGRKQLIASFSRLEAVGLVHTARMENMDTEETFYEYRLFSPLVPEMFFRTQHLLLLLRDKIGAHALRSLKAELISERPEEANDPYLTSEDLTVPFYEVFSLGTSTQETDWTSGSEGTESEHADGMGFVAGDADRTLPQLRFRYSDIIRRFPRNSLNRPYVERLEHREQAVSQVNYYADKYGLTLKELCQLLDEDNVFNIRGELLEQELERHAHAVYMQRHKHEEGRNWGLVEQIGIGKSESAAGVQTAGVVTETAPSIGFEVPEVLKARYDNAAYNAMLASEPYTKVLQLFIAENVSGPTLQLFSKLNIYYRIPDPVLNALIHHMRVCNLPWKPAYIEKLAASLQGEQIVSYGQAVIYFRKELDARNGNKERQSAAGNRGASGTTRSSTRKYSGTNSGKQKPKLPVHRPTEPAELLTAEEEAEFERMIRQLEQG